MECLREATNYRMFLKMYLEERAFSASSLGLRAGFHRGLLPEILSGKRRVTAKSAHALEGVLKLPAKAKLLFRLLVALEEQDLYPEISRSSLQKQLEEIKKSSWSKARRTLTSSPAPVESLFLNPENMTIFASCGEPGHPKSLDEITLRSRLPSQNVIKGLNALMNAGLVLFNKQSQLFETTDMHLFMSTQNKNAIFEKLLQGAATEAAKRIPIGISSPEEFFFTSQLCIQRSRLPDLKEQMRKLILEFADDAIETDGDSIVKLFTALHL